MAVYSVCVVEDDGLFAQTVCKMLVRYATERGFELRVSSFGSAVEFMERQSRYDLVLMDIGLPGINGIEAAEWLRTYDEEAQLIFVTNLSQFAIRGYSVGANDYILKPIRYMDFRLSLDRAFRVISRKATGSLVIPSRDGMRVIPTFDLCFIDVTNHSIAYHLADGSVVSARGSLNKVEETLSASTFVRVSKSCLVNMCHIRLIEGPALLLSCGDTAYISRGMRKEALARIANYFGGNL